MKGSSYYILFLFFFLISCQQNSPLNYEAYQSYIKDPSNGLLKTKEASKNLSFKASFIPNDQIIYTQWENNGHKGLDSLKQKYKDAKRFLFEIESSDNSNILFKDLKNYQEFNQRNMAMNFDLENCFTLVFSEDNELNPSLALFESNYGMGNKLTINLVFNDFPLDNNQRFKLKFEDRFFESGNQYFEFENNKIKNIPQLNYEVDN